MIGGIPKRPSGQGPEALFMQWVWDNMVSFLRSQDVSGNKVNHTTRGRFVIPAKAKNLPGIEIQMCDETGGSRTYVLFGYLKNEPPEITADSDYVTSDVDTVTADS